MLVTDKYNKKELSWNADTSNNDVVSWNNIEYLRNELKEISSMLNMHINDPSGGHTVVTDDSSGFIPSYLLVSLKDLQKKIDSVKSTLDKNVLPTGTIMWYRGELDDLPDCWENLSYSTSKCIVNNKLVDVVQNADKFNAANLHLIRLKDKQKSPSITKHAWLKEV